ncbi:MAG: hypothetical protein IJS28_12680 [Synergistaceae bacterium]|nr:hypothetical protein [Synergistaceae bacterium]
MYRRIFSALILILACSLAEAAPFIPEQPIIPVSELKPGMTGYILTVIKGTVPERIPIKIVSIVPDKPGRELSDRILFRITGKHKLAQGMSGSPVYVRGRLAGGVRSGWDLSDHMLGFATPIESMCAVFTNYSPKPRPTADTNSLTSVYISGISPGNSSIQSMGRTLGLSFVQGVSSGAESFSLSTERLRPGDPVGALFVWGDVEVGAFGTVTATARDGRFLAFAHDLNKAGLVSYPASKAYVHDTIDSIAFPFKLSSSQSINGTFTQDREAGAGGRFGVYPPSISATLIFKDLDINKEDKFAFRVIADEFMSRELLTKVFSALVEEAWGRKGQGTMSVNLRIDGKVAPEGWSRKEIFYSDENIFKDAFKQAGAIIDAVLTQPFTETMPAGFTLTVEATQKPKILLIEDVKLSADTARPGDEVGVTVTLRGWRTRPTKHTFTMKIPEDASEGTCELIVRGGSTDPMGQISVDEGWKSINSLQRMLAEFKAVDANNELILEINVDRLNNALKKALARRNGKKTNRDPDLLPEEEEYLSETKIRRIEEGSLRIYRSDYFIDGMMKRLIHVEK